MIAPILAIDATSDLGGKGKNLNFLAKKGFNVPSFKIISADYLASQLASAQAGKSKSEFIDNFQFEENVIEEINPLFQKGDYVAVRSSASVEDGGNHSFAGLFSSELYVPKSELKHALKRVWKSAYSDRVKSYAQQLGINIGQIKIAIIIQEMIDAEVSGVAFGANPATGNQEEIIINAVFGLGEGIVSGQLNADNYLVKEGKTKIDVAQKEEKLIFDSKKQAGLKKVKLPQPLKNKPCLQQNEIDEITELLQILKKEYGQPQDIEFAYQNNKLYLLQSRPITTLRKQEDDFHILWDNSNIIESYPGVTTPLTFSFISQSYKSAYQLFSGYMGVAPEVVSKNEHVFKNTLGLIKGRVYYNLRTWYLMLAMLPGYSLNARYMETMMGVKERFDIPDDYKLSRGQAYWSIFKTLIKMLRRMASLERKRASFMKLLNNTINNYKSVDYQNASAPILLNHFINFEKKLLNEWKAPLLNDFFAMIWFGMLQKSCHKYLKSNNKNIHNDLLCGSEDIISTQPVHRSIAIASTINKNPALKSLFNQEPSVIWESLLQSSKSPEKDLKKLIDDYIDDFGERCIGELKLETLSYEQNPTQLIKVLKGYVQQEITDKSTSNKIDLELRQSAEKEIAQKLKFKPIQKWWLKYILKKTRKLVSNRENLRYERTRAFGIVRKLFSAIGERFHEQKLIENPRDIFYLTKEEIEQFIEGRNTFTNLKSHIKVRKTEYEQFKNETAPPERFQTNGITYSSTLISKEEALEEGNTLSGIGCCPGIVTAKARVIHNPETIESLDGDILITSSTDPGWVTLFPSASGIIVERGSLLSHSAIVSREMGIPCIVSVTALLKKVKDGDTIKMDGSTGEIKILSA